MGEGSIWVRAALLYLTATNAVIGVWATLSPRGWYDDFPGFGRVWVSVDGPFNEHLVRDVGSWSLGLTVVCLLAAVSLHRRLVLAAGAAIAIQSIPHVAYHAANTDPYPEAIDKVGSIGGIAVTAAVGLALAAWALRQRDASDVSEVGGVSAAAG